MIGHTQVSSIWTGHRCGDGTCDYPYEFKAYGELGCQQDCGAETDLHPILVVLQGFFNDVTKFGVSLGQVPTLFPQVDTEFDS